MIVFLHTALQQRYPVYARRTGLFSYKRARKSHVHQNRFKTLNQRFQKFFSPSNILSPIEATSDNVASSKSSLCGLHGDVAALV